MQQTRHEKEYKKEEEERIMMHLSHNENEHVRATNSVPQDKLLVVRLHN